MYFSILITRNAPDRRFEEGRRRRWERRATILPRSPAKRNPDTQTYRFQTPARSLKQRKEAHTCLSAYIHFKQ